jgi:DNA-binding transcriptional regulator YhcF (GntR family)
MKISIERKEEIKAFILNNRDKSIQDIATIVNVPVGTVRAYYIWLVRDGQIEKKQNQKTKTLLNKLAKVYTEIEQNKVKKKLEKKLAKAEQNTYTNHGGLGKAEARELMQDAVVKSNLIGNVLTLAYKYFTIERAIDADVKGNNFISCERDIVTFKTMQTNLKKYKKDGFNGSVVFGELSQLIYGKNENSYAHLIMDYCGNLVTFKKEMEYAIQSNLIEVNGTISITISKPIRGFCEESKKLMNLVPKNNIDKRCESDIAIESYFNKITGFNYSVERFFYYNDRYPMALVIIKRLK